MEDILVMRSSEARRLHIIEQVIEKGLTQKQAAAHLGLTDRQIRRLKRRLLEEGERGLCHRSRGRPSNRRTDEKSKRQVLKIYQQEYAGFGPTRAAEKLSERNAIPLSDETLRLWLKAEGIAYPSRKKRPHRRWRQRRGQLGELLQMDGSHHDWLEGRGPWCVLMAYIDDATSRVYARFYEYEGTYPAMDSLRRYIQRDGVPLEVYIDKHSTYKSTAKQSEEQQLLDSKPMSQFQRSLQELAVEVIHADSPQAKGRIERLFRTFQDRLVKEMRLEKIASIEEANRFLEKYLPIYNRRFRVVPLKPGDLHRAAPPARELDRILCLKSERVLRKDWTISYEGKLYQIQKNIRAEKICVEEWLDGSLHLSHRGRSLPYTEILSRPLKVQPPSERNQTLKNSKPVADHPWRNFQFGRNRKRELAPNP
ncbi:ISNCY family transposase [Candidatus Manganitrophus noduliformans]|uniref:ISNCY family transposase n=1 Tax=Candidatus Manganitrophus noduliformans TaxID=2606439 RepID=A0A7X6DUN3_9BACT|nr:ISNCY family transposase [Candidatus Manganitrophus noduliformans]NKE73737.1 ISNCY family transposase [Candidatus Manganitrophus noduliformans]